MDSLLIYDMNSSKAKRERDLVAFPRSKGLHPDEAKGSPDHHPYFSFEMNEDTILSVTSLMCRHS